jgi:hypothetical protein
MCGDGRPPREPVLRQSAPGTEAAMLKAVPAESGEAAKSAQQEALDTTRTALDRVTREIAQLRAQAEDDYAAWQREIARLRSQSQDDEAAWRSSRDRMTAELATATKRIAELDGSGPWTCGCKREWPGDVCGCNQCGVVRMVPRSMMDEARRERDEARSEIRGLNADIDLQASAARGLEGRFAKLKEREQILLRVALGVKTYLNVNGGAYGAKAKMRIARDRIAAALQELVEL